MVIVLLLNYYIPSFAKKSVNALANSAGIFVTINSNVKLSFTPIAIAIETINPIRAYDMSFTPNFIDFKIELSPLFIRAIPISLPASNPMNTHVVLIGTLECNLK